MPRKKLPGITQADGTKYCTLRDENGRTNFIRVSPNNPRRQIDPAWLPVLKKQIKEQGQVLVQLQCEESPEDEETTVDVTNGQHRLEAVLQLGDEDPENKRWWKIPIVITRGNNKNQLLAAGQGDGLNFDMVDIINWTLMCHRAGASVAEMAAAKGMSTTWINNHMALISLSEESKAALRAKEITQAKAKQLAKKSAEAQADALAAIREAKANGNKSAGKVAPKRPRIKPLRKAVAAMEKAPGLSQLQIEGFRLGVQYALGEVTAEQLVEQYGLEL